MNNVKDVTQALNINFKGRSLKPVPNERKFYVVLVLGLQNKKCYAIDDGGRSDMDCIATAPGYFTILHRKNDDAPPIKCHKP
jgi:hypothetical protein